MLKIGKPYLKSDASHTRLCADIDCNGERHTLWFEVENKFAQYLCFERSDAFVLGLLQFAFIYGHDIECEAPMTDRLYHQLTKQFLPPFYRANKFTRDISKLGKGCGYAVKVTSPLLPEIEHPAGGNRIGTGLSCGVDSLHVFAKQADIDLACVWGTGVIFEDSSECEQDAQILAIQNRASEFSKHTGIELLKGWTNYDRRAFHGLKWDGMTTYGNLFCVYCLQKLWRKYYIASDCDIDNFNFKISDIRSDPARYEYFLFPFVTLANIQLEMDGATHKRIEKVEDLVHYEPSKKFLNVCWRTNKNHQNGTNDCPKCMRTLLDLDVFGVVDEYAEVFDVKYYHQYFHEYLAEYYRGLLHKDNFALELQPYLSKQHYSPLVRCKAMVIVVKKAIKKILRKGHTKIGGFSSKG